MCDEVYRRHRDAGVPLRARAVAASQSAQHERRQPATFVRDELRIRLGLRVDTICERLVEEYYHINVPAALAEGSLSMN